ncbi:hypothetical protein ACLMJK_001662 [Lecanora helva]
MFLQLLIFVPIVLAAVPLPPPPGIRPNSPSLVISSLAASSATAVPTPTASNCADVSEQMFPSCWNVLSMSEWMFKWNATTKTCDPDEIWSSCFSRMAFEDDNENYDCSTLGSLSCEVPELGKTPKEAHAFYGAYNIWATAQYFLMWEKAIYATSSQPAIANLVSTLDVQGAPTLTVNGLLIAIITNFGSGADTELYFISILQSVKNPAVLDTTQKYMSAQLAQLLAEVLSLAMTDFINGYFLIMAQNGQMMQNTTLTLSQLEANLESVIPTDIANFAS